MPDPVQAVPAPFRQPDPAGGREAALREAALKIEAGFLSEMLKAAGFGEARDGFGGGIGEEQFASFLREEQAMAMARTGGIGLAESLFEALKGRGDGR